MPSLTTLPKLTAAAVALTLTAACGSSDGNTANASGAATSTTAATVTSNAAPTPDAGVAAVSCGSDVVYGQLPSDLQSSQITRYTELVMDGQTVMRFAIGADVTDAQVERAVRLTRFYLTDVPGSTHGADKSNVRATLAANNATMIMPSGSHVEGNNIGLPGQELYANEIAAEGSTWYINNDFEHRDAAMEEIFHQIHDAGIGTTEPGALPAYQADLLARADTTAGTVWGIGSPDWISELRNEGSLAQEYIAAVIDSWYGLWGPWSGNDGMWDTYVAKTRTDVETEDPEGATLLKAFLPDVLEYEAYLDASFGGTFSLAFDEDQPYTHKSQYLRGARLTGTNPAGITGNHLDNTLRGNTADNTLDGGAGTDTAIFCNAQNQYTVTTDDAGVTTVTGPDGTDTLTDIETIAFIDGDVSLPAAG